MISPYNNPAYEFPLGRRDTYDPYGYPEFGNWVSGGLVGPEPDITTAFRVRDFWSMTGNSGWSIWVNIPVTFTASSLSGP